jgi:hypothetical protein
MTKLKCWKKVNDTKWISRERGLEIVTDDSSRVMFGHDLKWKVVAFIPNEEEHTARISEYKKKADAVAFAKRYMKENDRC